MRHTHTYNSSAFCCPLYKITESTSVFVGIITDFTMRKRRFLIQPSLCQGNGLRKTSASLKPREKANNFLIPLCRLNVFGWFRQKLF